MIGLVAVTAAGRAHAQRLARLWPDVKLYDGRAADALPAAYGECSGVVAFMATGIAVRVLGGLLADKSAEPGVVCVDEAARYAVALVGGHEGGANVLAERVAAALGCQPVVTTATDSAGVPSLDALARQAGLVVDESVSDIAEVTRAILDGRPVSLHRDQAWPLPPVPFDLCEDDSGQPLIEISDRTTAPRERPAVVLRPPSLVIGVGASRGVTAAEVLDLVDAALAEEQLSALSVSGVATVDAKADEAGLLAAAAERGWPVTFFNATELAAIDVPTPSEVVRAAVGTSSVAEAAALLAAGAGAALTPKHKSAMATVAVARRAPRGRLAVVGLGPGARSLVTPRAVDELRRAGVVVGLDQYVDQIRDLLSAGTRLLVSGLGDEEARARAAVEAALDGELVALVGSGDAGIYAMASPALDLADERIDVVVVPGVTAALAASAAVGSALGHDHCAISLSDLHTPWPAIERRVRAAAEGDFVVSFYNPRSAKRDWQLPKALAILGDHRPGTTPVAIVTHASRAAESTVLTTLEDIDVDQVGMHSLVLVGSSQSRYVAGRFVTPRGYTWAG